MDLRRSPYFLISLFMIYNCCDAGTVSTKDNVTARIGFHPTDFECTFTIDADESVHAGDILWQVERPSGVYQIIAEFTPPDVHGKHNQFTSTATGSEFKSRAVLYDVVSSGTNTYTAVFRLNEIKCEDEGNFRCLVGYTTSTGSYNQSSDVSLMVTAPAEQPYRAPVPVPEIIEEGMTVQFSCSANIGKPPGNIKWWRFRPNKSVPDYLGELSTTPTMVPGVCTYNVTSSISRLTVSRDDDRSVFRCSVSNALVTADRDYDTPHEDTKPLHVYYKVSTPVIEMNPNTTNHDVGAFAILSCNAKGYPSPLIDNHINYFLWTFRPRGKGDDVILISNNGLLGLQNLQPENSGRYTCTAHNGFSGHTFSSQSHVDISVHPVHTTESTATTGAPLQTDSTTVESTSVTSVETSVSGAVTSLTESTVEATTEIVNGSTPDYENCRNNPDIDCRMYNAEITCAVDGKYYPWAKANCPLYCGYCQVPTVTIECKDELTTCDEYQADLCSNHLFRLFREKNCRKFCGICKDVDYAYAQPLSAFG